LKSTRCRLSQRRWNPAGTHTTTRLDPQSIIPSCAPPNPRHIDCISLDHSFSSIRFIQHSFTHAHVADYLGLCRRHLHPSPSLLLLSSFSYQHFPRPTYSVRTIQTFFFFFSVARSVVATHTPGPWPANSPHSIPSRPETRTRTASNGPLASRSFHAWLGEPLSQPAQHPFRTLYSNTYSRLGTLYTQSTRTRIVTIANPGVRNAHW
jgi:hypothetical protein